MSLPEMRAQASEIIVTPGWQCCLLCGRTLTDRAAHDALEEPVLAAIRAEHPEWLSVDGACGPCVSHYRALLQERLTRELRVRPAAHRWRIWLNMLFTDRGRPAGVSGKLLR